MNFYSYSPYEGMEYHQTKQQAIDATDEAIRIMSAPNYGPADMDQITWGEVTERAVATGAAGYRLKRQDRLSYEAEHPQVIDGRMLDQNDSLVLVKNIHDKDLLYHDMVLSVAVIWQDLSAKIQRFKQHAFDDVTTVADLVFDKYKVKRGGKEGNMQFFTFDRRYKLLISIQKKNKLWARTAGRPGQDQRGP